MVKPKPSRRGEINAGAELRSKNPLISLFGRWGLSGKVGIGNAIPDGDNQWGDVWWWCPLNYVSA